MTKKRRYGLAASVAARREVVSADDCGPADEPAVVPRRCFADGRLWDRQGRSWHRVAEWLEPRETETLVVAGAHSMVEWCGGHMSVSVAGVVVNEEGLVLAIRRRDNGQWQPPGGVLELQETFEQGVRREVREETGVTVEIDRLTGVYKNLPLGVVALVFRCRPVAGRLRPTAESVEVGWLKESEVRERMSPAFAVRVLDALADSATAFRAHDGVNLLGPWRVGEGSRRLVTVCPRAVSAGLDYLYDHRCTRESASAGVAVELRESAMRSDFTAAGLPFPVLEDIDLGPAWREAFDDAEADLAQGRTTVFSSVEEFDAYARELVADDGEHLPRSA